MRRCIVHFGMNKTGSSSIQSTLYNAALGPAFHYIDLGVDNPSGPLLNAFMAPQRRLKSIRGRSPNATIAGVKKRGDVIINKLREQLRSAEASNLILSAEGLWRLTSEELSNLYQLIKPYVDHIEAVAYIRSPKGFMESNFQQLVKGGLNKLDIDLVYPKYQARFEKFDQVFGRENVHYWHFNPALFEGGCVVRDFCSRVGISGDITVRRVNEGFSCGAIASLYAYRKFYNQFPKRDEFNRENERLVKKLYDLPGPKLKFSSELIKPTIENYEGDIRWMEMRLQKNLTEDIYKHDDAAIKSEQDLLTFDRSAIDWLLNSLELEESAKAGILTDWANPVTVAGLIHKLRIKLTEVDKSSNEIGVKLGESASTVTKPSVSRVDIKKLIDEAQQPQKSDQPSSKESAVSTVNAVLTQIRQKLESTDTGAVVVPGLGRFTIRTVSSPPSDDYSSHKRIVFTPH